MGIGKTAVQVPMMLLADPWQGSIPFEPTQAGRRRTYLRQFASLAASHGYGGSVIARHLKVSPGAVSRYLSGTS